MTERKAGEITTFDTRAESNEILDREKRYKQIIECFEWAKFEGKEGLTAKECAVLMYRKGYIPTSERNFTAPRLTELSKKGIVEPIGKKKCFYTGKTVAVYGLRENCDG